MRRGVRLLSREDAPQPITEQSAVHIARRFALRDEERAALEAGRSRIAAIAVAFSIGFAVLLARSVTVTLTPPSGPAVAAAEAVHSGARADLVDRNGEILATTLETHSLYADPREVWDADETARSLAAVLPELDPAGIADRLRQRRAFVWVARNLTPTQRQAVFSLGMPGLHFVAEPRRVYPRGPLAAHVLGATDRDGVGVNGLELGLEDEIVEAGKRGRPLPLSLDMRVQFALADELRAGMARFTAKAAAGIVMDARTGEVLAMASLPDFDPNRAGAADENARLNRAATAQYEMGSTFKAFTVAMALEEGVATINSRFDATEPLRVGNHTINDYHAENRIMTVQEIFEHSSNIGAAKMAMEVGGERQRAFLRGIGLMDAAPGELPEIQSPLVPTDARWGEATIATVSYGHGMAVSELATVAAFAAIANGGNYVAPTFKVVPPGTEVAAKRVMSAGTAADVLRLMRLVVTDGTGKNAEADGFMVAGKTGTANKAVAGGYSNTKLVTSFAAVFPFDDPRYVVHILYDEPNPTPETYGYRTAGWNAAPTVSRVVTRIAPMLGVERREEPSSMMPAIQGAPILASYTGGGE